MTRFTITQFVKDFTQVGEEYKTVEVRNRFVADNFDDLQNLLMTLIDFSKGSIKFEVDKEEVAE